MKFDKERIVADAVKVKFVPKDEDKPVETQLKLKCCSKMERGKLI